MRKEKIKTKIKAGTTEDDTRIHLRVIKLTKKEDQDLFLLRLLELQKVLISQWNLPLIKIEIDWIQSHNKEIKLRTNFLTWNPKQWDLSLIQDSEPQQVLTSSIRL